MKKIMVVDDDAPLARFMGELLNEIDYETLIFTNSKEAVATFLDLHQELCLVVTDQTMPGITGQEFTEIIKEVDSRIPVIMTTGFMSNKESYEMCIGSADAFLSKPVDIPELLEVIDRLLNVA